MTTTAPVTMSSPVWRVVIVGESAERRAGIRQLLIRGSARPLSVVEAGDPAEGTRAVRGQGEAPDCVLLDDGMSDGGGAALLAALKGADGWPVCPVVVLGDDLGHERAREVHRAGAQDFVGKAWVTPETLTRAMENAVARWALARERHETEGRLRMAVEASDTGVWTWDMKTDAVTWSTECYRKLHIDVGSMDPTGADFFGLIHPDDRARVEAEVRAAVDAQSLFESEFQVVRPEGTVFWAANRGRALYDAEGRPVQMIGTLTDITAQKQAEHELRDSEERLRLAAEAGGFGTIDASFADRRVYWSPQMRAIVGAPPDLDPSLFFESPPPFIHPDDREIVGAMMRSFMVPGAPDVVEHEHRVVRPDGEVRWVAHRAKVYFAGEGPARRPVRMSGIMRDITDRKAAEAALEAANRHKDEFLAVLAHELRNPLAPLRNGLEILRRSGDRPRPDVHAMMDRQLSHLVRLVDDLLDVARISTGTVTLQKARVTLQAAAALAVEANRPQVDAARHTLVVDLPDDPLWIDADVTRIAQVLGNLLTNACKYTPEGGRIGLSVRREGDQAVARVSDDGLGIPGEALGEVFEMFAQVNRNLDRAQGGLGIGLSLVRRLVEMHGGTIRAESAGPGCGSAFTVRLPALSGEAAVATAKAEAPANEARVPLRILVVDDNRDGAESLALLLERSGNAVRTAFSGPEALTVARAFAPEAIFLDIGLPGLSGYDVARQIRADVSFGRPLLIALTGWGTDNDKQKASDAGFDHHLTKPVALSAVEALLLPLSRPARRPSPPKGGGLAG